MNGSLDADRPVGGVEAPLRTNYLQIIRLEINSHAKGGMQVPSIPWDLSLDPQCKIWPT